MSKIIGVIEVKKKRLPTGYKCYQLDFQYLGVRYFRRVLAIDMSGAGDMRSDWIRDIKKCHSSTPASDKDYAGAWAELEVVYGKGQTKDLLHQTLKEYAKNPQKIDIVREARSRLKKISCYKKVYGRMFLEDWKGRVSAAKDIDDQFFDDYKSHFCYTLGKFSGWRAEQIKSKAILRQMYQKRYISKDQMEAMQKSDAWKREQSTKKEYPMISDANIKTLLAAIKDDRPDFFRLYVFMLRTGRRVEEVTRTLRQNIQFEQGKFKALYVRAADAKMNRSSYLDAVDDEFEQLLWDAYQESEKYRSPYLFLTRKHRKCDQRKLCDYLRKKSQEVLGVVIRNHYFRHRFLTACGQARIPWAEVSKISGLKDQKVYMDYYDHSSQEGQRKVFALTKGIA